MRSGEHGAQARRAIFQRAGARALIADDASGQRGGCWARGGGVQPRDRAPEAPQLPLGASREMAPRGSHGGIGAISLGVQGERSSRKGLVRMWYCSGSVAARNGGQKSSCLHGAGGRRSATTPGRRSHSSSRANDALLRLVRSVAFLEL